MKKVLITIGILLFASVAYAQVANVPYGGTGISAIPNGGILVGSTTLRLTSTFNPIVNYITATSTTATSTLPVLKSKHYLYPDGTQFVNDNNGTDFIRIWNAYNYGALTDFGGEILWSKLGGTGSVEDTGGNQQPFMESNNLFYSNGFNLADQNANLYIGNLLYDTTGQSGSTGYVLQKYSSTQDKWVATSSLGIGSTLSGGTTNWLTYWTSPTTVGAIATSSLNLSIPLASTTGTLGVSNGGTGQSSFGQGWLNSDGTTITSSTSPTVNYITATSTTASSTFSDDIQLINSNIGESPNKTLNIYTSPITSGLAGNISLSTAMGISSNGGDVSVAPGGGTAAIVSGPGPRAGQFSFTGRQGGDSTIAGSNVNNGGTGGSFVMTGGIGGAAGNSTFINSPGAGGGFTFTGGTGGAITNASGSTGNSAGAGGGVSITAGGGASGVIASTSGGIGGGFSVTAGNGGAGGNGHLGGKGGAFLFTGGTGASSIQSTTTTNTGGNGSTITFAGGNGGGAANASTTIGGTGSAISFTSGNGGSCSGTGVSACTAGQGGGITFTGGTSGTTFSGFQGTNGADISFTAGAASNLVGATSTGGNVYIAAGAGSPSGNAGNVLLGMKSNGTAQGLVGIGTSTPSANAIMTVSESATTTAEMLIGSPNQTGGEIIMVDANGTHNTCTQIYTVAGVVLGAVITCPAQ